MARKSMRFVRGFPDRLTMELNRKGMSYSELAVRIGCDKKTVYNWKDGVCSPDIVSLGKLCAVFGCSADYLMFGTK